MFIHSFTHFFIFVVEYSSIYCSIHNVHLFIYSLIQYFNYSQLLFYVIYGMSDHFTMEKTPYEHKILLITL